MAEAVVGGMAEAVEQQLCADEVSLPSPAHEVLNLQRPASRSLFDVGDWRFERHTLKGI